MIVKGEDGILCRFEVDLPLDFASADGPPGAVAAKFFKAAYLAKTPEEQATLLEQANVPLYSSLKDALTTPRFAASGGGDLLEQFGKLYVFISSCASAAYRGEDFKSAGLPEGVVLSCKTTGEKDDHLTISLSYRKLALELQYPLT